MAGIAAFGAYVPRYRLGASTDGWNSRVERSVANFDEDSVTMAVAAGLDCLAGRDRDLIDGLLFATTTPPYAEKGCASIIATALDLRRDIFTADITDVLRAGTTAMKQALDSVAAGSARQVLVIASDNRQGAPKGDAERNSGDGAAAFIISSEGVIAEHEGSYSISENMMDVWRSAGDQFVRSWEDRFAIEEGLERILGDAIAGFMERQGIAARGRGQAGPLRSRRSSALPTGPPDGLCPGAGAGRHVRTPRQHRRGLRSYAFDLRAGGCHPRTTHRRGLLRRRQRRIGIPGHVGGKQRRSSHRRQWSPDRREVPG